MKHLTLEAKTLLSSGAAAAAQTAVNGAIVDMQGFDAVRFTVILGDVTSGSVLTLKAQSATTNDSGAMADITGATTASVTAGASDADSKIFTLDVIKPSKRYVRPVFTRTTQDAVVAAVIADLYHARNTPVTSADVIATAVKQG